MTDAAGSSPADALDLSDDPERLDLDLVTGWLASAYWSPGVSREVVGRAAAGSAVTGAYEGSTQIGYCRLVTDQATFAWLADVWVTESARGRGVGRRLVEHALARCAGWGLRRVLLATEDAHPLYASYGFVAPPEGRLLQLDGRGLAACAART